MGYYAQFAELCADPRLSEPERMEKLRHLATHTFEAVVNAPRPLGSNLPPLLQTERRIDTLRYVVQGFRAARFKGQWVNIAYIWCVDEEKKLGVSWLRDEHIIADNFLRRGVSSGDDEVDLYFSAQRCLDHVVRSTHGLVLNG